MTKKKSPPRCKPKSSPQAKASNPDLGEHFAIKIVGSTEEHRVRVQTLFSAEESVKLIGVVAGTLKENMDDTLLNSILGKMLSGLPPEFCAKVQGWLKEIHRFEINVVDHTMAPGQVTEPNLSLSHKDYLH